MIKLYGIPMSRAGRCLWALEEVGVEYENVSTNFVTDAKKPEFMAINPNGRIPALVDGDVTLFESMAINLYLAKKYDAGLQPKSIEDEARAVQWSFWGMTELESHLVQMLLNRVMRPEAERVPAEAEAAEEALRKPLGVLNDHLSDRSYLLGDTFSIADLNVASVLSVAAFVRLDLSGFSNVARWLGACTSRPAFKRARG